MIKENINTKNMLITVKLVLNLIYLYDIAIYQGWFQEGNQCLHNGGNRFRLINS